MVVNVVIINRKNLVRSSGQEFFFFLVERKLKPAMKITKCFQYPT